MKGNYIKIFIFITLHIIDKILNYAKFTVT